MTLGSPSLVAYGVTKVDENAPHSPNHGGKPDMNAPEGGEQDGEQHP